MGTSPFSHCGGKADDDGRRGPPFPLLTVLSCLPGHLPIAGPSISARIRDGAPT